MECNLFRTQKSRLIPLKKTRLPLIHSKNFQLTRSAKLTLDTCCDIKQKELSNFMTFSISELLKKKFVISFKELCCRDRMCLTVPLFAILLCVPLNKWFK